MILWRFLLTMVALLVIAASSSSTLAQDHPAAPEATGVPTSVVPDGTRFLVGLQDRLSTKKNKAGKRFQAKTLEPLVTAGGFVLAPGAEVRGHVDRVEPASKTGRARIWLTIDDIQTPRGRVPLIADVTGAPSAHSLRANGGEEGYIEGRADKRQREVEAAAGGAVVGALPGVATHDAKAAATGAAVGAVSGFMLSSMFGQELTLEKNTKLELTLERPLYLDLKSPRPAE
jgi:hypothetical protein